MVEEERYLDEKENIRQRSTDRRAERKAKNDEIRKKYGEQSCRRVYIYMYMLEVRFMCIFTKCYALPFLSPC